VNVTQKFAANLVRLRKLSRLSQHDLAVRSTLHRTEISLLERGQRLPRLDTMVKLAAALEVSTNDLVKGIEWIPDEDRGGRYREG
jgi:transcriptional regulator with XRE-family HTH domain